MPLEIETPILDNSKYEEIKRRALLRIPRYTPEWTDFNESDPGITLVELFAWLTESLFFQMNRVPERNYLKFLGLLGLELEPARPAEVQVVFTPQPGANTAPVLVGTQLGAESTKGGDSLIFETSEGLGLIRAELKDVQVFDGATFTQVSTANEQPGTGFRPFGWSPQPGAALYLGFDPGSQPTVEPVFPQVMRWHVWLPQELIAGKPLNSREISSPPEPPVQLVWEYRPRANLSRWKRLEQVADESVAFTREGKIEVRGPADPAITREGRAPQPRYWLRVRMESGAYPAGHAPLLDFLRPNVAAALNLTTVRGENLGFSLGTPGQSFQIQRTPVMKDTLQLDVLEGDATTPDVWQRVDDFLGSSPDEAHYTLNPSSGEIRFGDGQRGRIPIAGAAITAGFYRYGGGAAGNVGRGAVSSLLTAVLGVSSATNPRSAAGGRGEESVADFLKRAPSCITATVPFLLMTLPRWPDWWAAFPRLPPSPSSIPIIATLKYPGQ
jgi:predicted phage baseplate assembly protein